MTSQGPFAKEMRNPEPVITFSEKDRRVPHRHNRPLYVTAMVNGAEFKRTFLDGGANINAMPLEVFKAARIPDAHLVEHPIDINAFGGEARRTLGYVVVDLQVGKIRSATKFHVVEAPATYHLLLGRNWMHRYDAIPATSFQVMKAIWQGRVVDIPASVNPFGIAEAHLADAAFFDELDEDGELQPFRPIPLPQWKELQKQIACEAVPEKRRREDDTPKVEVKKDIKNTGRKDGKEKKPVCSSYIRKDGKKVYRL